MKSTELKKMLGTKFFTAKFIKKNGEQRTMNCRLGVAKDIKGTGKRFNDDDHNLITVYDLHKKGYRTIPVDRLLELKAKGVVIKF